MVTHTFLGTRWYFQFLHNLFRSISQLFREKFRLFYPLLSLATNLGSGKKVSLFTIMKTIGPGHSTLKCRGRCIRSKFYSIFGHFLSVMFGPLARRSGLTMWGAYVFARGGPNFPSSQYIFECGTSSAHPITMALLLMI